MIYIAGVDKSVGSFPPNDDSSSQIFFFPMLWLSQTFRVFCIQLEDGEIEGENHKPTY